MNIMNIIHLIHNKYNIVLEKVKFLVVLCEEVFWYGDRAGEGYLCFDGKYYAVNPSDPIAETVRRCVIECTLC